MRGKSHIRLGHYLIAHYMADISKPNCCAFLIGCLEPDRNPLTYLKGSFQHQWLRGHNYRNARRFMRRISQRLERKADWTVLDYYTLGKLIHYTADAFTRAHNDTFSTDLSDHREYEALLQEHFLSYLREDPNVDIPAAKSVMGVISSFHCLYEANDSGIHTDSLFALTACCCVVAVLISKPL